MNIDSNGSTPEFDDFVNAGEVEVALNDESAAEKPAEKPARRGPPREEKPAAAAATDTGADDGEDDEGDEDDDKPKKTPAEHQIERLKREKRELQRQLRDGGSNELATRLASLESRLTAGNGADTQPAGQKAAPDPSDADKYPLGHLDDRYIEDKLEWLADQKATKQADAVLQRQQEIERNAAARQMLEGLQTTVDTLAAKGTELYPDFQEDVVETGMKGEWDLSQPTFEAAAEADNGAQILYELSQDKKEAKRVAALSPYQQLKFVQERDAEIGTKGKARTKPQAGDPPTNTARGANSRTQVNPATDNLDDFEKQWERDAKGNKR